MATFPAWEQVSQDLLQLPIRGKTYTIPPLGYLDEIRIKEGQQAAQAVMDGDDTQRGKLLADEDFFRFILGDTLDEMRADNVPSLFIIHAVAVAHADATVGRNEALYVWERGLDPKALETDMQAIREAIDQAVPANRQQRRAAAKKTARKAPAKKAPRSTRSHSTGEGN